MGDHRREELVDHALEAIAVAVLSGRGGGRRRRLFAGLFR